jgi:hypothetical protein
MQEVFFTILVVWILFRILGSGSYFSNTRKETTRPNQGSAFRNTPPTSNPSKKKIADDTGEYVDFEEIKD